MRQVFIFLFFWFLSSSFSWGQSLPHLKLFTEDWYPYQYYDGKELQGISVDLMDELLTASGSFQTREDISLVPWARGYHALQHERGTVLFSMTRTPEREKLFRWVGPIFQNTTYLIALKSKNIKIKSLEDLSHYRFGTIRDDASEIFLTRLGVSERQFHRNSTTKSNLRLLHAGRIDFIVSGRDAFDGDIMITGLNSDDFEAVYVADISSIWIAFHLDTEDWIIQKFQNSLENIKSNGRYEEILLKYGKVINDYNTFLAN